MPALSEGLRNLKEGEKRQILLSASQAYGFYDPSLIIQISRKKISHGTKLKVGDQVLLPAHGNMLRDFRVIQEDCRTVTLDGNHPLAGQDLIFLVEAVQIRDATPDEVEECRVETKVQLYH
jgi:FKBP-type peptidyl-prolyl cis-trans isomerase SlyD